MHCSELECPDERCESRPRLKCVQVDHLDLPSPLSHNWCMVRTTPSPPFFMRPWLAYLNWVPSKNSLVPWIAVTWTCDSWLVLTHHYRHQLQHLPSSFSHEKLNCPYCAYTMQSYRHSFWLSKDSTVSLFCDRFLLIICVIVPYCILILDMYSRSFDPVNNNHTASQ